ncbi:hypothetical protein ACU686_26605 [Yinghuangia aomiensis]
MNLSFTVTVQVDDSATDNLGEALGRTAEQIPDDLTDYISTALQGSTLGRFAQVTVTRTPEPCDGESPHYRWTLDHEDRTGNLADYVRDWRTAHYSSLDISSSVRYGDTHVPVEVHKGEPSNGWMTYLIAVGPDRAQTVIDAEA